MSREAHLSRFRLPGRYATLLAVAALCLLWGASPAWAAAAGGGHHKSSGLSMIVLLAVVLLLVGVAGAARAGYNRRRLVRAEASAAEAGTGSESEPRLAS